MMDIHPGKEAQQTWKSQIKEDLNFPGKKSAEDVSFASSFLMQDNASYHQTKEHHYAESIPS
jgi:hypothetical protein